VRPEHRQLLEEGRLLFLSPFEARQRRATVELAQYRNRFVAALADKILVAYAGPYGKTEQFCREVLAWGKQVYTFESEANAHLIALGTRAESPGWI